MAKRQISYNQVQQSNNSVSSENSAAVEVQQSNNSVLSENSAVVEIDDQIFQPNTYEQAFQLSSNQEQIIYDQKGLDYVSNLPFVNKRDAAGNLIINGNVQAVTDEEAAQYNETVIIEANDRLYTNSSVTRAIDTQFKYFKFPPNIITRQTDIGEIDLEIPDNNFDPFSARYTPDPESWLNFPYGGGADVWSAPDAGDGRYTPLDFDYVLKGPQQIYPKRYTITPEMIETGKDLRITYKVPVHNNLPPSPDITVNIYSPAQVAASQLTSNIFDGINNAVNELISIRDVFNGLITTTSFSAENPGPINISYTYPQIAAQYRNQYGTVGDEIPILDQIFAEVSNQLSSIISDLSRPVEPELNQINRESDSQGFITGSIFYEIANTSFVSVAVSSVNLLSNQIIDAGERIQRLLRRITNLDYFFALQNFQEQLTTLVLLRLQNLPLVTSVQNAQNIVTKSETTIPNPNSPSIYFFTRLQRQAPDWVPSVDLAPASRLVRAQGWDELRGETIVRNQDLIPWSTWFVEGYSTKNNTYNRSKNRSEGGFYWGSAAYFNVDLIDPE